MRKGFTLIEILVSITLMAILVGVYFLVGNPAGQLAASRNSQRTLNLQTIMNDVYLYIDDQPSEQFASCAAGSLPIGTSSAKFMASASTSANYNIGPCLAAVNIHSLPFDPSASSSYFNSMTDYNTGFKISVNASGTVITLSAPYAELNKTISISR